MSFLRIGFYLCCLVSPLMATTYRGGNSIRKALPKVCSEVVMQGISKLQNPFLRKEIRSFIYTSSLSQSPTKVLLAMLADPNNTKELFAYLVSRFQEKGYKIKKHQLMKKALVCADYSLIKYLLDKHLYDDRYFSKTTHYFFLAKFPNFRILYALLEGVGQVQLLPAYLNYLWSVIMSVNLVSWLVGLVYTNSISTWLQKVISQSYFAKFSFFIAIQFGKLCYVLYLVRTVSIEANYLFHVLYGNRSKDEKETIALLLIARGVNVNNQVLLVERKEFPPSLKRLAILGLCTYQKIAPIHLAVEQNLLRVVKALVAQKADISLQAIYMEDIVNYRLLQNPMLSQLPIQFVRIQDICNNKGPNTLCKKVLDLAIPGSDVANYLKKKIIKKK